MIDNETLLRGIEATENEVAHAIQDNHSRELEVIFAALEQVLRGYNEFADQKEILDDKLESAQLFLTVKSFNSLRVAMKVLENGYTQQALTLIRTVMEDQLVAKDIKTHPPTLDAIFEDAGKMGKREFTFQSMAERLPPEAKEVWDKKYGFASSFAAHPRPMSMNKLVGFEQGLKMAPKPGPRYDRSMVIPTLVLAMVELLEVKNTVAELTSGSNWEYDAQPVFNVVEFTYRNLVTLMKKELQELDDASG